MIGFTQELNIMKSAAHAHAMLAAFLLISHATPVPSRAQTIWAEGERPGRLTVSWHPFWYDKAWKKVGEVPLTRGRQTVSFRMSSENHHHGAIDSFVFTTEPFEPGGAARPGQARARGRGRDGGPAQAGTWPFLPERDTFRPDAAFDLRELNEKAAGQSGFVRLSRDGESFELGDGTPVRFWAVTTYVQRDRSA